MKSFFLKTILLLTICSFTHAQALDFTFSFSASNGYTGAVPNPALDGTISGEFFGLQDNDSSTIPTEVVIDSAPSAFGLTLPYVFSQSEILDGTSLSVTNGVLSENGSFYVGTPDTTINLSFDLIGFNVLDTPAGIGGSPIADVTFTPVEAPEPSCLALLSVATLCFAILRLRHKALPSTPNV